MNTPLRAEDVKSRIAELEKETRVLEERLGKRAKETYQSITPANLLKAAFHEISGNSTIQQSLLNMALKWGLSIAGGRLFWKPGGGVAKKAIGALLQLSNGQEIRQQLLIWKKFIAHLFANDKKTN